MSSGTGPPERHTASVSTGARRIVAVAVVVVLGATVVLFDAIRVSAEGGWGPQKPGFFPMVVGIGLMLFGIAFLISTTLRPDAALLEHAAAEHARTHWRTLWSVTGGLVVYVFVLEPLGYVTATSLFFVVTARLAGSRSPVRDLVVAVLFSLAVFLGFTEILGVRLPVGLLDLVL